VTASGHFGSRIDTRISQPETTGGDQNGGLLACMERIGNP